MLVRCPRCGKKLKVQDEQVRPSGTKFRCPGCKGLFLARRPTPGFSPAAAAGVDLPGNNSEDKTPPSMHAEFGNHSVGSLSASFSESKPDNESETGIFRLENPLSNWSVEPTRHDKNESTEAPGEELPTENRGGVPGEASGEQDPFDWDVCGPGPTPNLEAPHQSELGPRESETNSNGPKPERPTEVARESEKVPSEPLRPSFGDPMERARRLARTIMSDIALYNTRVVENSIREDTFFQVMGEEIREGMKLYNSRVSQEIRAKTDYFREAVKDYYDRKRSELAAN